MALEVQNPDNGDSQDASKGFVHLDSFDQLEAWSRASVDPLQRSNTPLFYRADDHVVQQEKSKVMLIHDYEGSYLDYEACQGTMIEQEKYSCEYLQHVETFVYFSHKLITIPPPTWTNTCHRNGVKILGTLIVELDTPQIERILEQQDGQFWVAERLAQIAEVYGFDGWLINIEKPFPILHWSSSKLEAFLRQLRYLMGSNRKVIWYDALITLNVVWYQNALNYLNLPFALAAGAILTNYAWNPEMVKQAKEIAGRTELGAENVYFGIDAWAQNTHDGKYPRTTYPPVTGGGTGIGLGVRVLAEHGIGAGIFAPGWSFEHFKGHNHEIERAVWSGDALPPDLSCDCTPIGLHSIVPYQQHPVIKYAQCSPAGTRSFLHTDFRWAFSKCRNQDNSRKLRAHLGRQSILPASRTAELRSTLCAYSEKSIGKMIAELKSSPTRCSFSLFLDSGTTISAHEPIVARFRLFDVCISDARMIELRLVYETKTNTGVELALLANESNYLILPDSAQEQNECVKSFDDTANRPLRSIDLVLRGDFQYIQNLDQGFLDLFSLTIVPRSEEKAAASIHDIHVERRSSLDYMYERMVWNISHRPNSTESGMPYSNMTGPFAYFSLFMDNRKIGVAFALEFHIPRSDLAAAKTAGSVVMSIVGVGFDGAMIASAEKVLTWPQDDEDDWVLVDASSEELSR